MSVNEITSLQNDRIKAIRALEMRKVRRERGLFVAEGASVLVSARDAGWDIETLVFERGTVASGVRRELLDWARAGRADLLAVSATVLQKLAARDNPQSMLGVFRQRFCELSVPQPDAGDGLPVWVALEEVRDPGNLGTIIRTVHAAGGCGVILVGSCVDPYSRECVRATMGSVFAVPIVKAGRAEFCNFVGRWPGAVAGLHLGGAVDFRKAEYRAPVLIVMGSEGPGLSDELSALCGTKVRIPMAEGIDSLNLSVATALTLYQVRADKLRV